MRIVQSYGIVHASRNKTAANTETQSSRVIKHGSPLFQRTMIFCCVLVIRRIINKNSATQKKAQYLIIDVSGEEGQMWLLLLTVEQEIT